MNKIILSVTIIISVLLFGVVCVQHLQLDDCVKQLQYEKNNIKALMFKQDSLNSSNRTLQLTLEQLEYFNDSLSNTIKNNIRKSKVDKNKISQLQYLLSTTSRVDTITLKDTVFIKNTYLDTNITDFKWYNLHLAINHPNTLIVNPSFKNEFTTIFHYKKETVNPPKKCFIGRLFQKKHLVTETIIVNNNPYSTVDTTRFIEVIKY